MKVRCEYCGKKIAPQGMLCRISFKHRWMTLAKFARNPEVRMFMFVELGYFPEDQLMLPAPNPLTVYSRRPLGFMAAPIPEHRRPKGYKLPYGYGRPFEILRGQLHNNRPVY